MSLPKLIEIIRKNCPAGTWSQGVKLARAGGVAVESRDEEEIVLRVRTPGRPVAPSAVLYPGEREWDCDCGGRVSPCEHVAAAAIALGPDGPGAPDGTGAGAAAAGASAAGPPSVATSWGRVVYRFSKVPGGLTVRRAIARGDGSETPLDGTLSGYLAKPAQAATVQPEQMDLQADRLFETNARAILPATKLDALLRVLIGARNVFLDGRPVAIVEEEVRPRAIVEDQGEDVVVRVERDPRVTDVVSAGVVLCGDALQRAAETELTGGWLQNLPIVQRFGPRQIGELTTRTLPELSKRMLVDVRSGRLPKIVRDVPPRVVLELHQLGTGLSVLPTLVYGVPPCVRIDDGRLVYLRGPVPVRDEVAEKRLVDRLRHELNLIPGRRASFQGPEATQFADKLKRWRGDLTGDAARLVGAPVRLVPQLEVTTLPARDDGAPQLKIDLRFAVEGQRSDARGAPAGTATVDAAAVVRAWQEGLGLVPLDGGGWAPLPEGWLGKHGQRLADLLAARDADGRVANHALPALAALCDELDHPAPPGLDRLAPLFEGFDKLPRAALPGDLTATLRPYQQQGVDWLGFLRGAGLGGVLADDMGLGKTLQTLCAVRGKTLVVCPTSVLFNWAAELRRFRPGLKLAVYHGAGRELDDAADVTITSYALLRLDTARLTAKRWGTVVLDEAQAIKNPDSQVARAAYSLQADFRLALTGTPIENRLEELWSLLHFTNRGLLGGRREFDDRFARPIAEGESGAPERLRARVRPFVLRRLKRDVAPELPPRTDALLRVELDEKERAVYDAVRAATRADIVSILEGGGNVLAALEALLRLRQAACHPALVPGQSAASSSKVEALVGALENAIADGHKALVFSQWTSLLDLVEAPLRAAGVAFARLDGSTRDREGVVSGFQAPDGPPVLLVSLKAGGTGLNLTAADHVFLVDPWWNPAVEEQAADRAHRIGQDRPVFVYRLVALGTVEERILELQDKKRKIAEAAIGDGGAAAGITRDDLLALLA